MSVLKMKSKDNCEKGATEMDTSGKYKLEKKFYDKNQSRKRQFSN